MEAVLTEREKDEEKENEMESNCVKPKNPEQFVNQNDETISAKTSDKMDENSDIEKDSKNDTTIVISSGSESNDEAKPIMPKKNFKHTKINTYKRLLHTHSSSRCSADHVIKIGISLCRLNFLKSSQRTGPSNVAELSSLEKFCSNVLLSEKELSCELCPFKTNFISALNYHKESVHRSEDGKLICAVCKNFNTTDYIMYHSHMKNSHNASLKTINWKGGPFLCNNCSYETNFRKALVKHEERCFDKPANSGDRDIPTDTGKANVAAHTPRTTANNQSLRSLLPTQKVSQSMVTKTGLKTTQISPNGPVLALPANAKPVPTAAGQPQQYAINNQLYQLIQSPNGHGYVLSPLTGVVLQPNTKSILKTPTISTSVASSSSASSSTTVTISSSIVTTNSSVNKNTVSKRPNTVASSYIPINGSKEICELCNKGARDKFALRQHLLLSHNFKIPQELMDMVKRPYACDFCDRRYWTSQGLINHRISDHKAERAAANVLADLKRKTSIPRSANSIRTSNGQNPNAKISKSGQRIYKCHICKVNTSGIVNHMSTLHGVTVKVMFERGECMVCGENIKGRSSLEEHITTVHSELFRRRAGSSNSRDSKKKSDFKCKSCRVRFKTEVQLKEHDKLMHGFPCTRCSESFLNERTKAAHFKKVHSDERDICPMCSQEVQVGEPFINHVEKHLNECSVRVEKIQANDIGKMKSKEEMKDNKREINRDLNGKLIDEDEDVMILENMPKKIKLFEKNFDNRSIGKNHQIDEPIIKRVKFLDDKEK